MRDRTSREKLIAFMLRLGRESGVKGRVYFTGGASAVLEGWRETTVDIDVELEGEADRLLRALPEIKEELHINIELAAPHHFIPELPGWRDRSRYIGQEGELLFFHYDFYSQALSKIERGHASDEADVASMFNTNLIEPDELVRLFEVIQPQLYRYPAIDPGTLRCRVLEVARQRGGIRR